MANLADAGKAVPPPRLLYRAGCCAHCRKLIRNPERMTPIFYVPTNDGDGTGPVYLHRNCEAAYNGESPNAQAGQAEEAREPQEEEAPRLSGGSEPDPLLPKVR